MTKEKTTLIKASSEQVQTFLEEFSTWSVKNNKLHRYYIFHDFVQAFGFMAEAALIIEHSNHHPEWSNSDKNVTVDLMTHEANGITERDFSLAQQLESIAMRRQ